MKTLVLVAAAVLLAVVVRAVAVAQEDTAGSAVDSAEVGGGADSSTVVVVATYFHGNRRCATCRKLEAYSQEAVTQGFVDELDAGRLVWRVVNFDEEENAHYLDDYGLYSQALVLSREVNGIETEWNNLDKIWQLVGNKEEFLNYVTASTRAFLSPTKSE